MPNGLNYQMNSALGQVARNNWNATMAPGVGQSGPVQQPPAPGGGNASYFQGGYANPYDQRIGNGALPYGIQGTQDRAYTGFVTPDMLVENRLNNLLNDNSAYMNNARREGLEFAGARGQLNGSMAAGSAMREAIRQGLNVAAPDAATYGRVQSQNLQHLNERQLADINAQTQGAGFAAELAATGMREAGSTQRQRESLAFEGEQAELGRHFTDYQRQQALRDYAARTGIDLRAQRQTFTQNLFEMGMMDPEIFTPEVMGSYADLYLGMSDDIWNDDMSYIDDLYDGFYW